MTSQMTVWLYRGGKRGEKNQPRALIELGIGARAGRRDTAGLVRYCGSDEILSFQYHADRLIVDRFDSAD
jgi:hypothetical protein